MEEQIPQQTPQQIPLQEKPLAQNEPLKPPLQPLNIKSTGLPPIVLILLLAFGFAAAAAAFAFFNKSALPKPKAQPKQQIQTVAKTQPIAAPLEVEVVQPKATETVSAPVSNKPLPTLTLSGILCGKDGSFALINGRIVREGSNVEGAKLVKVFSDRVELDFDGRSIILRAR